MKVIMEIILSISTAIFAIIVIAGAVSTSRTKKSSWN